MSSTAFRRPKRWFADAGMLSSSLAVLTARREQCRLNVNSPQARAMGRSSEHVHVVEEVTDDGHVIMQNPWGPAGGRQEDDPVYKPGALRLTEDEYRERCANVTIGEGADLGH
ncbi:hypothetical protein I8D64_09890 [Brachybacterium sp. MASK1Z-5]|uniref:Uncharacterized protein n=1 Tax=Brachybacterium halotolerans TaxID=2795215 RepID=A0ABS1BAM1_9MICO|nr:hypothetical protein [Brachybacterium halotolerans]MBK0331714.1 hypothetical protein [Brachybacterium halotolerans]